MTTETNIDPEALKAGTFTSPEQTRGERPLTTPGRYDGCTANIKEVKASQWPWPDGSPKYQVRVDFSCPTYDGVLTRYMNLQMTLGKDYYGFMAAAFRNNIPVGAKPTDANGKTVDVTVSHKLEKGRKSEVWAFSVPVAKPAPAAK